MAITRLLELVFIHRLQAKRKELYFIYLFIYLFTPGMHSREDTGSVAFTLERLPEHHQEKPVFVVEEQGRDRWSRKIEFLFACIGFCVGYGNMWRFPYMCFKNGGGRYRLPLLITPCVQGS